MDLYFTGAVIVSALLAIYAIYDVFKNKRNKTQLLLLIPFWIVIVLMILKWGF
jgi:hypothetical protein